jgi:RNA polymerase sigma-70 factor (ECF subfamily)
MSGSSTADAVLLERLRAAPSERDGVFEEIFRAHGARALALCERLCGSRSMAEDAVQETFLEVYRGLAGFRGEAQIGTWIYRIALRTALRMRARRPATAEITDELAPDPIEPHDALVARERVRHVQRAFDALPAEQRAVVALFAVDGLSHGEIAQILGIPEGTVWSRLHKGRKALAAACAPP